ASLSISNTKYRNNRTHTPYTTLFRSYAVRRHPGRGCQRGFQAGLGRRHARGADRVRQRGGPACACGVHPMAAQVPCHRGKAAKRSEEHTSELQSREKLVCHLLLEKKK